LKLLHPSLNLAALKLRGLVSIHEGARHMLMRDGRQRSSRIHLPLHKSMTPEGAIAAMLHATVFQVYATWSGACRHCFAPVVVMLHQRLL
jgi:hypothetical protein